MRLYLEETGERAFRLPATGSVREAFQPAADGPYPNLVYKFAELDQGQAVVFLKLASVDGSESILKRAMKAARPRGITAALAFRIGERTGLFQSYVRSAPTADRRLYIIRAHVLVSPVGNRFLSAHRVVAAERVTESLPFGVVADPRPCLVNFCAGARYEVVSRDEEESVARAAMAVAAGLSRAIEVGFATVREGPVEASDHSSARYAAGESRR